MRPAGSGIGGARAAFLGLLGVLAVLVGALGASASTYSIVPGGPPVVVTTTVVDENATVTFDGTAGRRISLKMSDVTIGTSTCCSTKVSILKPDGKALVSPTYVGTKGGFIDTRTLPVTGTYTILVDPQKSATGSMTLTLYDVPADVTGTITPGGDPVTVTTTVPGQNANLTFGGTAAQRVSLKVGPTCCFTKVSILKPNGTKLVAKYFGTSGGFIDTESLPVTGTYTIVVDPQSDATGSVTLTLYDVPPDATAAITPGGPAVTVTTTVPGQNAKVTFDGTAGQRVSLKVGPTCCVTKISIFDPFGNTVLSPTYVGTAGGFIDTKKLSATGTHTIVVDPQSDATGSVTLTLYDVPPDVTAAITAGGAAVTVTTTVPGQNANLTFDGTAGQRVSLKIGPICCTTKVSILNPDGTTLVSPKWIGTAGGFIDTTTLPATGVYTILVDPQFDATGSVTLTLYDVPPDVTAAITAGGAAVTVTTTVPGQNANLTFDGTAGQRVSLKVGPACCTTKVSILNANGKTLVSKTFFSTGGFVDTTTLPKTGTYTILVDPQSFATGSVTLTLYDVPADVTAAITPGGVPVTVSITVPGQNARVTFSGTAGQRVSLEVAPTCCNARVSILNPDGTTLVGPKAIGKAGGFIDTVTLKTTGTHTILVDPYNDEIGDVTLSLYDVPPDLTGTITPGGASVTLTITTPGQNATLVFSGTAGQRVSLRAWTPCCITRVSILNPDSSVLVPAKTFATGGGFIDTTTLPTTGTYTIVLDPQNDATGEFTLSLYDVPPDVAGTIAIDGPAVTVTTTVPGQNARVTFTGSASDGVKLLVGPFNCCSTKVSILNPDGSTLVAPAAFNPDGGTMHAHLPYSGTYTIFVDPQGPNVGDVHLRLQLDNTAPAPPMLSLSESSPDSHVVGTTFFYRPSGAGSSFAVSATTSDGGSGVQKVTFPGLSGGFTPTSAKDDTASPYTQSYSWSSGATYDYAFNVVTAYDKVGNTASSTFAVSRDADAPTTSDNTSSIGSSWKNTSQTVTLTRSDALSGAVATYYTIDGSTPTTGSAQGTSISLTADGVYTIKYFSVDNVSNTEAVKTAGTQIRIDKTKPSSATLDPLPSVIKNGQVLTGSGSDALSGVASIAYYYCSGSSCTPSTLIGSSSTAPGYSVTWSSQPADGVYQVLARVSDAAGNTLDSAKQTVTIDNTAPNTTITKSPANPTNQTSASFEFSSSESASTFQCQLDGGGWASCTSPKSYSGLAAGSHTFEVRATDVAGNTDATPASYTWTIDLTAPETTITKGPANPTNQTSASFEFTSSESASTFQCQLDGGGWASCSSPKSYSGLAAGSHTFEVRAVDPAGNTDATPASYAWTIDLTAPETTITSQPATPTNLTSGTFEFTSSEPGSSFACSLDGAAYASCTSPKSYSALTEGSHTFRVRATDTAGNTDGTPASYTWTVDLTAPETTITKAPANPTNQTSASFEFASSETGSSFRCQLDGGGWASCTSPRSYSGLAAGSHTFEVEATDAAGNTDATPASYTWTIDLTAPDTTITSGPASPTNQTSASFEFSSSESGSTFQCQVDAGGWTSCTSPKSYTGLSAGSHTFEVRAIDPAGNTDPTAATWTWTIDATAPDTTITAKPPSPTNSTSATFEFTSSESGSTFHCSLDGAAFSLCISPAEYLLLAEGSHTFQVRAIDSAGNVDGTPASYTWTVDLTAPETTITKAPANPTNQTSASFEFASSESGSSFQCSLDGAGYTSCTSPQSYTGLAAGSHTFEVKATDPAGNTDASPATYTWTIDLTAPDATITAGPASPTNQTSATFEFTSSESGSTFQCQLDAGGWTSCTSPKSYTSLAAGSHTFEVKATDPAGNTDPTAASYTWTVDLTAPETTITKAPANPTNQTSATFEFTSSESGSSFQCSLDGAAYTSCTSPQSYTGLAAGSHTFRVRATDPAGNTDTTPATHTWTVDTAAPDTSITSKPSNPTNSASASFEFSSSETGSTFQCSLDGSVFSACTSPQSYTGLAAGSHTFDVRATDPAGNTDPTPASYTWTIDVTAPAAPVIESPADGSTNATGDVTLSGTAEAGSTVEVFDGTTSKGATTASSTGSWSKTLIDVADGSHTYTAKATDAAGNTSAASNSVTVTVDTTPPNTTIGTGPATSTSSTTAAFSFSADDPAATFECSLDGAAFTPCTSPTYYYDLTEGSHTFQVRATDSAGNTDPTPATWNWTVDLTAPAAPAITSPADGSTNTTGTITLAGTADPGSFVEIYDGTTKLLGATQADSSGNWSRNLTGVADGAHTYTAKATDAAGNTSAASNSVTVTVDTTAPETTITAGPASPTNSTSASFEFSSSEPGSTFQCSLDGAAFAGCTSPQSYTGLATGTHTFEVRATDSVGNTDATPAAHAWTIDVAAPETTITSGPTDPTTSTSATFEFTSSEPGSTFQCSLDGGAYVACTSPSTYSGLAVGAHTFEVRAVDPAGNADPTPATYSWTIT